MEPFRPLVDLFVSSCVTEADQSELKPAIKQQLFNLTNYMVLQSNRRFRMISAIGRLAESFSRILQGDGTKLDLPALLPLEAYHYE